MEKFTNNQIILAIEQFLEYGEQQLGVSQNGYFSGEGWAARCLRYHKNKLSENCLCGYNEKTGARADIICPVHDNL